MTTKKCTKCGKIKPLNEFYNSKAEKDGKQTYCKDCQKVHDDEYKKGNEEKLKKYNKKYHEKNKEKRKEYDKKYYHHGGGREERGHESMYTNKHCTSYLGVAVAERLIKHLFNDVIMMPYGFPDYDMICNKGKKINVKSSTIRVRQSNYSTMNYWRFTINCNKIAEFFLCVAFDNINDINPLYMWMIPGKELNNQSDISISQSTIHKWDQYKFDITDAKKCCDIMKDIKHLP